MRQFHEYSLNADDVDLLDKNLPLVLVDFYEWIRSDPNLSPILDKSSKTPEGLAQLQHRHWMTLFREGPTEAFVENSKRIGEIHYRVGLTPNYYLSAYDFILAKLSQIICKHIPDDAKRAVQLTAKVTSMLLRDMEAALTSFNIKTATEEATEAANRFANDLMDSSISVSMAVNEAAIDNARMAKAITDANTQAQEISMAVEKTVAGINQISSSTEQVAELAKQSENTAQSNKQTIMKTVNDIEEVASVVNQASEAVDRLAASSKKISDIVSTIEKIASQTNLLALNATIEAARAGEAGKGFAVVASEVKSLSNQTAGATVEIKDRIHALLAEMTNITSSMQKATEVVRIGQQSMNETSSGIEELEKNVLDVSDRMIEVAGILADQAQSSEEVSNGVDVIVEGAKRNVVSLENLSDNMTIVEKQILQQVVKFMEYDIPHKVLRIAKSDHIIWKKRLADILADKETLWDDELADHKCCRLGKFYYNEGLEQYGHLDSFKAIEVPHIDVHKWGLKAVEHYKKKEMDEALQAVDEVEKASKLVIEGLDKLLTEVTQ